MSESGLNPFLDLNIFSKLKQTNCISYFCTAELHQLITWHGTSKCEGPLQVTAELDFLPKNFPVLDQEERITLLSNTHRFKSVKQNTKCSRTAPKEPVCPSSPFGHRATQPTPRPSATAWVAASLPRCLRPASRRCRRWLGLSWTLAGPPGTMWWVSSPWHSVGVQPSR